MLGSAILASYKTENSFSRMLGSKTMLQRAVELDEIYGRKQVDLNAFREQRPANSNTLCYNCQERGHYSANCPKPQRPLRSPSPNQATRSQGSYGNNTNRKNEYQLPPKNTTPTTTQTTDTEIKSQNGNQMRINRVEFTDSINGYCKINGHQTKFLADTGANKTVLNVEVFPEDERNDFTSCNFRVLLADGTPTEVLGMKRCVIQLGNHSVTMDVIVSKNVPEQCLLGLDFLQKHPSTKSFINGLKSAISDASETIDTIKDIHLFSIPSNDESVIDTSQ